MRAKLLNICKTAKIYHKKTRTSLQIIAYYRIRSLGERTNEIAGRFCTKWNVVVIRYVGSGVKKLVGEGVEELGGRRRWTENDEGAVK